MVLNTLLEKRIQQSGSDAYSFYKALSKDSFVLIYLGVFDDDLTTILMDINDAGKSEMKASRKKISFLIAECFQNIVRHSNILSKQSCGADLPEMFILRDRGAIHHLVTTNVVGNKDKIKLKNSIDHLNSLSKDQLKELYLNVFTGDRQSDKGGAGLGLIEMARKSGMAPTYEFTQLENGFSNFFFQVNVLPRDFEGNVSEEDTSLKPAIAIYNKMTAEKIVLLQKGDFSSQAVMPLIKLFENNLSLKDEQIEVAKKVITLLVEMLENITDHAKEMNGIREGIFYVAEKEPGKYEINTGNFIPVSQSLILKERLDAIAKLGDNKQSKKYNRQLEKLSDGEKFKPGLGLIEISKHSAGKLIYDFKPIGHSLSFFSLKVNLS